MTREATDNFGNVAYQRGNYPYGDMWYDTGTASLSVKRKFTSYQMEPELSGSLNDAMAREHSARLGRFHLPDPVHRVRSRDPQALNRYSYVQNDPVNFIDPEGRFLVAVCTPAGGCFQPCWGDWDNPENPDCGGPFIILPSFPPAPLPDCTVPLYRATCSVSPDGGQATLACQWGGPNTCCNPTFKSTSYFQPRRKYSCVNNCLTWRDGGASHTVCCCSNTTVGRNCNAIPGVTTRTCETIVTPR